MSDAPERIWATPMDSEVCLSGMFIPAGVDRPNVDARHYTRSDLIPQWQDISTAPIETRFLALDESGYVTPVTKGSGADYDWWRDDDNACESEFTHWMPLPLPPTDRSWCGRCEG